jgi:hypothetical protein
MLGILVVAIEEGCARLFIPFREKVRVSPSSTVVCQPGIGIDKIV